MVHMVLTSSIISTAVTSSPAWLAKDYATLAVAIIVGLITGSIAFTQMKIASAKIKLDLYNKRFAVYEAALEYHQAIWSKDKEPLAEMDEKAKAFVKAYRESQFLFAPKDGVYDTLSVILQDGAKVVYFEREKRNPQDINDLHLMGSNANKGRKSFSENLLTLEKQMEKYIQFRDVKGWSMRD